VTFHLQQISAFAARSSRPEKPPEQYLSRQEGSLLGCLSLGLVRLVRSVRLVRWVHLVCSIRSVRSFVWFVRFVRFV